MTSPAKKHFQKAMAAQEAKQAADTGLRKDLSQYELMLAQLRQHRMQLKGIQSIQNKATKKAELLPDYADYVAGVLEADAGIEDDVIVTVMVWRIDAGDFEGALQIAEYVIKHDLKAPDTFNRTVGCMIAEEFAESVDDEFPLPVLQKVAELVLGEDMPDKVALKLRKALGKHPVLQEEEPATALNHLRIADGLDKRAGVKKEITKLEKLIKEQEEQQEQKPE